MLDRNHWVTIYAAGAIAMSITFSSFEDASRVDKTVAPFIWPMVLAVAAPLVFMKDDDNGE